MQSLCIVPPTCWSSCMCTPVGVLLQTAPVVNQFHLPCSFNVWLHWRYRLPSPLSHAEPHRSFISFLFQGPDLFSSAALTNFNMEKIHFKSPVATKPQTYFHSRASDVLSCSITLILCIKA